MLGGRNIVVNRMDAIYRLVCCSKFLSHMKSVSINTKVYSEHPSFRKKHMDSSYIFIFRRGR